eukprot:31529-Pelagococcus_subviridis.AAC.11
MNGETWRNTRGTGGTGRARRRRRAPARDASSATTARPCPPARRTRRRGITTWRLRSCGRPARADLVWGRERRDRTRSRRSDD